MKLTSFLSLLVAVVFSTAALSDGGGTPDQAKAMAEKAAAHFRQAGTATAIADFAKPEWRDRDLYVVVIRSSDGIMLANAATPALVGRSVMDLRDVDGKYMSREQMAVKDAAWIDYKWKDPQTNTVRPKSTYTIRVSEDTILGVGAYK
jgi:cytochrome c